MKVQTIGDLTGRFSFGAVFRRDNGLFDTERFKNSYEKAGFAVSRNI
jgi:hypothetical protein